MVWWRRRTAKSSYDGLLGFLTEPLITPRANVCQKTTSQTRTQNPQRRTWIMAGHVHCQTCAAAENIKDKFTPGRRQRQNMFPSLCMFYNPHLNESVQEMYIKWTVLFDTAGKTLTFKTKLNMWMNLQFLYLLNFINLCHLKKKKSCM